MDWPRLLESAGLGEIRLLREVEKQLTATVTKYYQDQSLGDHTDNAVRMRATELLADLLGKRKAELDVHVDVVEVIPPPKPEDPAPDED